MKMSLMFAALVAATLSVRPCAAQEAVFVDNGEARSVRIAHRVDQVIDELLHRCVPDDIEAEGWRRSAQLWVADRQDRPEAHDGAESCIGMSTPRSSATSIARS